METGATMQERRKLPNGRRESDYNQTWCDERHRKLDSQMQDLHDDQGEVHRRLDRLHGTVFKILLVGFGNLFGVAMLCITMWLKSEGVL